MEELKRIFAEFLEEGISAESKARYGPAVSNYYKALSILCSYIITNRLRKVPKNHAEIFLFLKVSFPKVYKIVDAVFIVYTNSYSHIMNQEDCAKLKNAIHKIAGHGRIEKEFEAYLKKI